MHKHKFFLSLTIFLSVCALSGCANLIPQQSEDGSAPVTSVQTVHTPNTPNDYYNSPNGRVYSDTNQTTPSKKPTQYTYPNNTAISQANAATANPEPVQAPGLKVDGQYSSLWDVIRSGFSMDHYYNKKVVQDFVKFYSKNSSMLERMTTQSTPYLYYIVEQLQSRNMPTELALLPIVESGFNPHARSYCGALGLWQLMPAAARRFDAGDENGWFNGRESIQESTNAALDYLQYLYNFFNGNWVLALAAYNAGEGTVQNAIAYNQRRDRPTDFWNLRLPTATKNYVPQLLALAIIINDPAKYGVHLPDVPNKQVIAKAKLPKQMSLAQAAKFAGIAEAKLKALNPGLTRNVTPPSFLGHYTLNLPISKVEAFEKNCAANPGVTGLERYAVATSRQGGHKTYRVQRGDSLYSISHFTGIPIATLKSYNHLHNDNIRVGQVLRYPVNATAAYQYVHYTIRRGDNLSRIAEKYHVNVFEIMQWNNLKNANQIHPGQRLVIREKISY